MNKPEQPTRAKPTGYPTKEQFEKLEPLLDGRITEQPECKHNWAKKGESEVCIECGEQPNTELDKDMTLIRD